MSSISLALAGISQAQTQFAGSAARLSQAGLSEGSSGDIVDLSADIVSMLADRNAVDLSVRVAHAAEDMEKNLISLVA